MNQIQKYKIEDESFENEFSENCHPEIQSEYPLSEPMVNQKNINPIPTNQSNDQILKISNSQYNSNQVNQGTMNSINMNLKENLNEPNEVNFTNMEINDDSITQNTLNENQNFHHVQVIDEDVENFKRRLDILVKNFRTDTLKDFMAIKRNLLLEQKSVIDSEKQKNDALLSAKGDLIEHLKDDLTKTQHYLNSQIAIKEKFVDIRYKQKYNEYITNLKKGAFYGVLKKYYDKKKRNKNKINGMRNQHMKALKNVIFQALKQNWKDMKIYKIVSTKENECNNKLNEMAQYYGKEISDLRNKLQEANLIIQKTNESKKALQENLKKVLLRGVTCMNLEAMNVLEKGEGANMFSNMMNLMENNISNMSNQNNINMIGNTDMGNISNISNSPMMMNNNMLVNNNMNSNPMMMNTNIPSSNSPLSNIPNSNTSNNTNTKQIVQPKIIEVSQSFQPTVFESNSNINPTAKDANWINASSVPSNTKNKILFNKNYQPNTMNVRNIINQEGKEEEYNMEINDTERDNEIEEQIDERPYENNLMPMIPISKDIQPINYIQQKEESSSYYEEMQKNLMNIKNEFNVIKQNSIMDDSINNSEYSGRDNFIIQGNQPVISYGNIESNFNKGSKNTSINNNETASKTNMSNGINGTGINNSNNTNSNTTGNSALKNNKKVIPKKNISKPTGMTKTPSKGNLNTKKGNVGIGGNKGKK
ncbi:MAG: hypothetical protein MJ252_01990 [archaeon]|nr:hypothetical protein [archaeon]